MGEEVKQDLLKTIDYCIKKKFNEKELCDFKAYIENQSTDPTYARTIDSLHTQVIDMLTKSISNFSSYKNDIDKEKLESIKTELMNFNHEKDVLFPLAEEALRLLETPNLETPNKDKSEKLKKNLDEIFFKFEYSQFCLELLALCWDEDLAELIENLEKGQEKLENFYQVNEQFKSIISAYIDTPTILPSSKEIKIWQKSLIKTIEYSDEQLNHVITTNLSLSSPFHGIHFDSEKTHENFENIITQTDSVIQMFEKFLPYSKSLQSEVKQIHDTNKKWALAIGFYIKKSWADYFSLVDEDEKKLLKDKIDSADKSFKKMNTYQSKLNKLCNELNFRDPQSIRVLHYSTESTPIPLHDVMDNGTRRKQTEEEAVDTFIPTINQTPNELKKYASISSQIATTPVTQPRCNTLIIDSVETKTVQYKKDNGICVTAFIDKTNDLKSKSFSKQIMKWWSNVPPDDELVRAKSVIESHLAFHGNAPLHFSNAANSEYRIPSARIKAMVLYCQHMGYEYYDHTGCEMNSLSEKQWNMLKKQFDDINLKHGLGTGQVDPMIDPAKNINGEDQKNWLINTRKLKELYTVTNSDIETNPSPNKKPKGWH